MNGFPTELWTLRRVRDLIEREVGIRQSISNVHLLMQSLGFSPQLAVCRAREQDEKAVEAFRKKDWPRLKKKPSARGEPSR